MISWMLFLGYCIIFALGYFQQLDTYIYQCLASFQTPRITNLMKIITFFGSTLGIILVCLLCMMKSWKIGFKISQHVIIVAVINQIMKIFVARSRPNVLRLVVESSYSFPSAHAMVSFALYGMIAYFLWRKMKPISIILMIFVFLIGISRIYLGVHFASDIIAGYLFSLAYLNTFFVFMKNHKWSSHT